MSGEEHGQPSAVERAVRQAAEQAARQIARQALVKLGAALGAKGAAVVAVVIAVIVLVVLLIVLLVAVIGAAFQSSTAVWPVSVATDAAGNYQASGWTISSRFGWRDDPQGGGSEFHDGLDLANPDGTCPFGYHCGAPSIFDGTVQYVGWDMAASGDPSKTGGGEMVIVANGEQDHQTIYAHLEPYRLYVQLQGRIDDDYGRYDDYASYQPIGRGPLKPELANGGIEMTCLNDMPNFIPTRSGAGTVVFLYDRPASCTTTVVWGQRGGDWRGWTPDQPGARAGDGQRAELRWQTPIDPGQRAQDVALRFRAHLVPPPPPPPITDTATLTPVPAAPAPIAARGGVVAPGQGAASSDLRAQNHLATPAAALPDGRIGQPRSCETLQGGWTRCAWSLSDIPTERERFASMPDPWIAAAHVAPGVQRPLDQHEDDSALPIASTPVPGRLPIAPGERNQPLGMGGLIRPPLAEASPTAVSVDTAITIDARLPEQLLLHAPERPELLGPILTITSSAAEQLQITARYEDPAAPGPDDTGTIIIDVPAGTLAGYAAPHIGLTVLPGTASGAQACLSLEWRGLTSGARGSTRTCTITADPQSISPTAPPASTGGPGSSGPDCAPQTLVRLPNVTAPNPRLIAPAAASFATVRAEILERTGVDALAILADVLRAPSFTTSKAGVLQTSWHKAGRAVDLNQSGPFVRVAEGRMFRLYVNNVDITQIFEAHGWQRIPVQGDTAEWWHYEWHSDDIAWTSAMLQVWDLPTLQAAFPEIAWTTIGCAGGSNTGGDGASNPQETEQMCVLGAPRFRSAVETIAGCGPPVRAGDRVYQLDSTLGFVGLSGRTTGPHLHLGMHVRSYDGSWPFVDICTPEWLQGRTLPIDANCFTDMADPLAFLPQAPGNAGLSGDDAPALKSQLNQSRGGTPTPIIPEGAPYQLPPPGYPGALVFTPIPNATPAGQYWSPYADGGQYGGGSVGAWFCSIWGGWPWCS